MTETPDTIETEPADFADVFDDWIGGATINKRSVVVYGKPGLYAEYQQLERELEVLRSNGQGDDALADPEIIWREERQVEIYQEWTDSKSTWTVRAMRQADFDEVRETMDEAGVVEPKEPDLPTVPTLPVNPTSHQSKVHTEAVKRYRTEMEAAEPLVHEYEKAQAAYQSVWNLYVIAQSVERIDFADGRSSDGVSVDRLRRMKETLGEHQLTLLLGASTDATTKEPVLQAPFLSATSQTDPT